MESTIFLFNYFKVSFFSSRFLVKLLLCSRVQNTLTEVHAGNYYNHECVSFTEEPTSEHKRAICVCDCASPLFHSSVRAVQPSDIHLTSSRRTGMLTASGQIGPSTESCLTGRRVSFPCCLTVGTEEAIWFIMLSIKGLHITDQSD